MRSVRDRKREAFQECSIRQSDHNHTPETNYRLLLRVSSHLDADSHHYPPSPWSIADLAAQYTRPARRVRIDDALTQRRISLARRPPVAPFRKDVEAQGPHRLWREPSRAK